MTHNAHQYCEHRILALRLRSECLSQRVERPKIASTPLSCPVCAIGRHVLGPDLAHIATPDVLQDVLGSLHSSNSRTGRTPDEGSLRPLLPGAEAQWHERTTRLESFPYSLWATGLVSLRTFNSPPLRAPRRTSLSLAAVNGLTQSHSRFGPLWTWVLAHSSPLCTSRRIWRRGAQAPH